MKRNRSQLFSSGLYLESLRQLRLMGLIYLFCCLIFTALPTLLNYNQTPTAALYAPLLYVYMYIAPVTLTYAAFGFLMLRNQSDFYHSLPVTRECMYLTRVAAVMTYVFATIVLSLLTVYLLQLLISPSTLHWDYLPYLISYFTLGALLVMGCTLIGICASGTYFSSFIVTGLVMFLPRFISVIVATMIGEAAPIVDLDQTSIFINPNYNIPTGLFASLLSFGQIEYQAESNVFRLGSHLYTGMLGLLYVVLGCVLHHFRKSENASRSAPNRSLQHLYRGLISLPLFLILGMMLAMDRETLWNEPLLTWIILAAALAVYFIYELITTKKLRCLLPALYVLPIVVAVSVAIPMLGKGLGRQLLHDLPDKEDIASIAVDVDAAERFYVQYTKCNLASIEYDEEELIGLAHDGLTTAVDQIDRGLSRVGYNSVSVRFRLHGGRTLTRTIRLTPDQYARFEQLRQSNDSYRQAAVQLPDSSQVTDLNFQNVSFTNQEDLNRIWDSYCEEYAQLSFADQLALNQSLTSTSDLVFSEVTAVEEVGEVYAESSAAYDSVAELYVNGTVGRHSFYDFYALTEKTPKTLLLVMQTINHMCQEDTLGALAGMQETLAATPADEAYFSASLYFHDPDGTYSGPSETGWSIVSEDVPLSEDPSTADVLRILALLQQGSTDIQDLDHPLVMMNVGLSLYGENSYSLYTDTIFLRLTLEQMEELRMLLAKYEYPLG